MLFYSFKYRFYDTCMITQIFNSKIKKLTKNKYQKDPIFPRKKKYKKTPNSLKQERYFLVQVRKYEIFF